MFSCRFIWIEWSKCRYNCVNFDKSRRKYIHSLFVVCFSLSLYALLYQLKGETTTFVSFSIFISWNVSRRWPFVLGVVFVIYAFFFKLSQDKWPQLVSSTMKEEIVQRNTQLWLSLSPIYNQHVWHNGWSSHSSLPKRKPQITSPPAIHVGCQAFCWPSTNASITSNKYPFGLPLLFYVLVQIIILLWD